MENKIAYYRSRLGISQEQLAKRSSISRTYLSDIENNKTNASGKIIIRIARELKQPVEEIFLIYS